MGKGSSRRPTNESVYQQNWDAIFGKKETITENQCKECKVGIVFDLDAHTVVCTQCNYRKTTHEL